MQAADAALEPGGLVVDGDDDLDVRRRRGRERRRGERESGRRRALACTEHRSRAVRARWDDPERFLGAP